MKGPLHAIRRRRSERPANGVENTQAATEAPTQAQPTADLGSASPPHASDQAPPNADTASTTPPPPGDPAPAGAEVPAGQEPVPDRPSFRQRGRLRRRLRYLRRVRELGFRDLGGLVFDQHRFSQVNISLVEGKLAALGAVDAELRALEHALDDRRPLTELREPGVSVCSRCGTLHGSEARFCPSCGTPVRGPLAIAEVGEAATPPVGDTAAATPPASTPPPPAQPHAPAPLQLQPLAPPADPAPAEPRVGAATPPPPAPPAPAPPAPAPPAREAPASEPTPDDEQPTEVMRAVDEDGADSSAADSDPQAEAVAQRSGERHEP